MDCSQKNIEEKIGYRQILKQTNYCKLIIANLINRFGDSIDSLAFTWLVYAATKSASWSAIIYAINVLPTILLQPFAGAFVERRNKKILMIISDMLRGVMVIVLAVTYLTGIVNPWILAVFTLCISSVEAFCVPASTAIIPKLLEEKYYEFGTSLNSVASRVTELIGTAVAGVIIGIFGIGTAILLDAATFFASAVIKMFLRVQEDVLRSKGDIADRTKEYITDLKEGLRYVRTRQLVLNFCILAFLVNAMLTPLNSLLTPLTVEVLGQGSEMLSVIGIAMVIGMVLGSIVFPYLSKKCSVRSFICISGVGMAGCIGGMTAGSHFLGNQPMIYIITVASTFGAGFFVDLVSSATSVQFMKCVDQDHLARAAALMNAGNVAAMPLTAFLISIFVKYVDVKNMILTCSAICAIIFSVAWIIKVKMEEEE